MRNFRRDEQTKRAPPPVTSRLGQCIWGCLGETRTGTWRGRRTWWPHRCAYGERCSLAVAGCSVGDEVSCCPCFTLSRSSREEYTNRTPGKGGHPSM